MINIKESSRDNPVERLECDCGGQVFMAIHHDFIEGSCTKCGKTYCIRVGSNTMWNCCSEPVNGCGTTCRDKIYDK
jgi:ribosomal protein S27AE